MHVNKINLTKADLTSKKGDVSFGRTKKEHKSWGARINSETQDVSFKLFTYPDAKSVSVIVRSKDDPKNTHTFKMDNKGKGVFEKTGISNTLVKNGDSYQYFVKKNDGNVELIKDPYSFKQEEVNGPSIIYDQSQYVWKNDEKWQRSPERITRNSDGTDGHKSLRETRIYALNPDSFTDKRSYEGVISKLKNIKQVGFNTIELMHIENTFDINWGYDGVDKHAPSQKLGGPDKLKELVDAIHGEGMNVVFDVVPNHLGPDGNQLGRSGPYIKGPNAFGDAINYEGKDSEYVRDYMINAMMNWAEFYHADGLRLDMTKYMESDYTIKQLAGEMNYHHPDVFLIAEDGRGGISVDGKGNYWENLDEVHDKRVTSKLNTDEYGKDESQEEHAKKIENFIKGNVSLANLGMDSEWDFNFYHELNDALYSTKTDRLMKAILCAQDSVKYVDSHDEIGNFEGTRRVAKLMVPKLRLNESITLGYQDIERAKEYSSMKNKSFEDTLQTVTFQKAQFVSEALATKYQKGELDKYKIQPETSPADAKVLREKFQKEILAPLNINQTDNISMRKLERAFGESFEQCKMALAFTFGIPGPKMLFQGDEALDLTPFRFFRKFESVPHEDYLYTEKGYKPGYAALEESTLGKIKYSKDGKIRMNSYRVLTRDLNKLNNENKALRTGYIDEASIVEHPASSVLAFNSKKNENEIYTITNFSDVNYREDKYNEYYIKFPKGTWVEVLNTNDKKYGGDGRHMNEKPIVSDGNANQPINLSKYSTIYFKRVD